MAEPDWLERLEDRQQLQHFSREMLNYSGKRTLTGSELELLSLLYLTETGCTPLDLSHRSGMKKEAVSRCLRQLQEKACILRERCPGDERSYLLHLTDAGRQALEENYGPILRPMYRLKRSMGEDFMTLFALIRRANEVLNQTDF